MTSTSFLKDKAKEEGKGEGTYLAYAAQKQRRNEDKAKANEGGVIHAQHIPRKMPSLTFIYVHPKRRLDPPL
ncbi:unnamed protein product [Musa acuminata subsp. burmannicoides]